MTDEQHSRLQCLLERFQQGDRSAGDELLGQTCDRLHRLAHEMLKGYPRLQRWEQTDDVLQSALLRLHRTLQQVTPATLRDYYRLAALQIRRELLDLVRHHYGPHGPAARRQTNAGAADAPSAATAPYERADVTFEPGRLAAWSEFHRQADALPEEEQEVFDLLWYQGLTPADAAALLGVSARTVKRRMHAASLRLHDALDGRFQRIKALREICTMTDADRISDLLLDWDDLREQGRDVTAEELCRDCPELTGELRRRIAALLAMQRVPNGSGDGRATLAAARQPERRPPPLGVPGYELLQVVGSGGMGVVYKARDLRLKRTVALKMVLSGAHATPDQLARFKTEAEAAARLQHPNIVQIHEVGEHGGLPYLALEYVEGGNLADRLGDRPLPSREAAELVRALALAIQHAHERGVVHRDLKPANILVGNREQGIGNREEPPRAGSAVPCSLFPKIADFGLARRLDVSGRQTSTGAVLGTPAYMAPEQASGRAHDVGPTADVYSLGAILYQLLTGRPPFEAPTVLKTLERVCSEPPERPRSLSPDIPADLETVCLKCLEKDPASRYPSARALADDLGRYLQGEPILARAVTVFGRLTRLLNHTPDIALARPFSVAPMLTLAPFPFLGQLALYLLAADRPWYAGASIGVMLAVGFLAVGAVYLVHRSGLTMQSAAMSRHMWSVRLGQLLAGLLAPVVLAGMTPPGTRWDPLTSYPVWALIFGVTFFSIGGVVWGRLYLIGLGWFAAALLMPLRLEWAAVAFGLLLSTTLTTIALHARAKGAAAVRALASAAPGRV